MISNTSKMTKREKHTELSVKQRHYRRDVLAALLKWSFGIVVAVAVSYLLSYWQRPLWPAAVLFLSFTLFLPVIWWCLQLPHRGKMQQATRIYLTGATIEIALFMLLMPPELILIGMIGFILLVRVAVFFETEKVVRWLGVACIILYSIMLVFRYYVAFPEVNLGVVGRFILYLIPVFVLALFAVLDQIGTKYLRDALLVSETARHDLAESYSTLEQQTAALAESQKNLTQLAAKLERSNHELQIVNEELKSFAYIISHDLRAPLINLKGFAAELGEATRMINESIGEVLPRLNERQRETVTVALQEEVPEALSFIDVSVERMDHFINSILKLSRLGRRQLDFDPIDMNQLVQMTLQTLAHQIEQQQVQVIVESLPQIVADRVSMEQIMGNLLANAVAYLDRERPGKIRVTGKCNSHEAVFSIEDNGRGIAEEDKHKVFELFRRAGRQDVPGEGMGLAYVQTLVRRHGGRIWFDSKCGVGTTFTFTISKETNIA